jgi:hypothetical protein
MMNNWMNDCCLHFILHKMYALHKNARARNKRS